MIAISQEPTDHFRNIHELRVLRGHRCNTKADVADMCSRIAKPGSHVIALTIYVRTFFHIIISIQHGKKNFHVFRSFVLGVKIFS